MSKLKTVVSVALRWSWFALLLMLAFGYLAAGLSDPPANRQVKARIVEGQETSFAPAKHDEPLDQAIKDVDKVWADSLAEKGLSPAEPASWLTVCRRISLALVGNGVSLEEIRQLEQVPESARAAVHVQNLLQDPRYHHYWAERWTRFLVGTDNGQFIVYRRRRFRIWLSEVFAANRPYDQMVRDLITAKGLWTDRPEVNFLTATFDSNDGKADPVRLAARTARAFLGLRIDCLQCHNDFLGNVNLGDRRLNRGRGCRSDFHQLAAFLHQRQDQRAAGRA